MYTYVYVCEEGKRGGAQRQRIDLLFVSRLVYYIQLLLCDATFNQCKYYSSDGGQICMCEFIHRHFCSTTGRIRTNATSA